MIKFNQNIHVAPITGGIAKDRPEQTYASYGKPYFEVLLMLFEEIENLITSQHNLRPINFITAEIREMDSHLQSAHYPIKQEYI